MKIGDLVTWRVREGIEEPEFGVILEKFKASQRKDTHWWVKFINGIHSHKNRILCQERHLILVEDIKQKRT